MTCVFTCRPQVTIPNSDPLFRAKRTALQPHSLTTQHTFDLGRNKPLPPALLPFMRLALATTEEQVSEWEERRSDRGESLDCKAHTHRQATHRQHS